MGSRTIALVSVSICAAAKVLGYRHTETVVDEDDLAARNPAVVGENVNRLSHAGGQFPAGATSVSPSSAIT
jgi:hypothetical protein